MPIRRRLNFATALADSHRNVISLREERVRKARSTANSNSTGGKRSSCTPGRGPPTQSDDEDAHEGEDVGRKRARFEASLEPESSPVRNAHVEPSSDDALNLFAYPDSSPVKLRRWGV